MLPLFQADTQTAFVLLLQTGTAVKGSRKKKNMPSHLLTSDFRFYIIIQTVVFYLLQVGESLLKLSLLRLSLGQSLSLLTRLLLQAGDPSCQIKTDQSSEECVSIRKNTHIHSPIHQSQPEVSLDRLLTASDLLCYNDVFSYTYTQCSD